MILIYSESLSWVPWLKEGKVVVMMAADNTVGDEGDINVLVAGDGNEDATKCLRHL